MAVASSVAGVGTHLVAIVPGQAVKMIRQRMGSKSISSKPAINTIDRCNDLPAALGSHRPAPINQVRFWDGVKQVAFTKRWPVQTVVCIENNFVGFRGPAGFA